MSTDHRPSFGQTVKEGIGLGIGIRIGSEIAGAVGGLIRAIGAGNVLLVVMMTLLSPAVLLFVGVAIMAAISPFVMVIAYLTMENRGDLNETFVVFGIIGFIGYFCFGCLALYNWIFRKERDDAHDKRMEAAKALERARRGSKSGKAAARAKAAQVEPNHGWGQALLAIGVVLFPAWLVLVLVPRFPRRHRITAGVLLAVSLSIVAVQYLIMRRQGLLP